MGDGTEPVPRLDATTLQQLQREVMKTITRQELDRLTRNTWRMYQAPKNAARLAQLRKAIEAKRDILKRNDPR